MDAYFPIRKLSQGNQILAPKRPRIHAQMTSSSYADRSQYRESRSRKTSLRWTRMDRNRSSPIRFTPPVCSYLRRLRTAEFTAPRKFGNVDQMELSFFARRARLKTRPTGALESLSAHLSGVGRVVYACAGCGPREISQRCLCSRFVRALIDRR